MRSSGTAWATSPRPAASSSSTTSSPSTSRSGTHPETGYVNGAKGVSLLNQYRGSTYGVSLDGDFQTWVYRTDLFSDENEKKAFADKYGYDARAAQDLEAARRDRDLLPPAGQGPARLDRPAQPGLGLHQLVPALCVDGLAEPVPVRRCRQAADQFRSRRRGDQRIHRTRSPTSRRTRSPGAGRSSTATSPRAARR